MSQQDLFDLTGNLNYAGMPGEESSGRSSSGRSSSGKSGGGRKSGFSPARKSKKSSAKSAAAGRKNRERRGASGFKIPGRRSIKGSNAAQDQKTAAGSSFGIINNDEDGFEVNVRNDEPIIRRLDEDKALPRWRQDIQVNLAAAAMLLVLMSLLLTAEESPELIPFALPGVAVFLIVASLEYINKDRLKLYVSAALLVALIAALILLRKYIGNGWALIMNQLYDEGEMVQSYVYDRFSVGETGDEHPYRSMHFALIWGSSLLGLITAAPPSEYRRPVALVIAAFAMIAFAYYGIVPSAVCIAVMAAALLFAMARGNIISTLAVLLAGAVLFGAIIFFDPGESYSISRADEKFRDRFALRSAYLEGDDTMYDDYESLEQNIQDQQTLDTETSDSEFLTQNKGIVTAVVIVLVIAAIAAAVWMFIRRLKKRQAEHRAGIDSADPREAIVAMFPYAVRWLQPAGIDTSGVPFTSVIPAVRADISEQYADRYAGMYDLWKEAAYSDHEMTEDNRNEMNSFVKDTMAMVREKSDLKARIINTFKYAL